MDEVEGRVRGFPGARSSASSPHGESCIQGLSRARTRPLAPLTAEAAPRGARGKPVHHPGLAPARTIARRRGDIQTPPTWQRRTWGPRRPSTDGSRRRATGTAPWKTWGPYLSERQWGTVREDYSDDGDAWNYFTHDQARSRAYRWGEDGLAGISDDQQRLCFALALWNGSDPILKERLFGLTNSEGNHGEDVKEYYFYLDSTPTHSYMKYLYKYPQAAFPYDDLVDDEPAPRPRATSSTSCSTPASSTTTATSTSSSSTPRRRPTTS